MAPRSPAMTQRLVQVAAAANAAPYGTKQAVYDAACAELGVSMATLMRALGEVSVRAPRQRRSDAGQVALPLEEAQIISALLMSSMRKSNTKRLLSITQAMSVLRANGEVKAEWVDAATGEVRLLSDSAIARALRGYGLHPDQLLQPAPAVDLRSLHPNHVWQIDASLCVLYYLRPTCEAETGLQVMEADRFYKNKPRNLASVAADRVWSYEVTDHYGGNIFLDYVMGAESGQNICDSFIEAITPREGEPFSGVPLMVQMDQGSVSALFLNLLRRLDVKPLPHAPRNARATGQVENARNIIERQFESALRLRPVRDLADLRAHARRWARHFNATAVHSRHGRTRTDMWLTITEQQLRVAPDRDLCRTLMTHAPVERRVQQNLCVEFNGQFYRVADVPRVMVGEKLLVTYSPYQPNAAVVVDTAADGTELLHVVPLVPRNEAGFAADANVIGEDYTRPALTLADENRAKVAAIELGNGSQQQHEQQRKAITRGQALPFGGRIDPYKPLDTTLPTAMPKRGTPLVPTTVVAAPAAAETVLQGFALAKALAAQGVQMSPERNAQLTAWYPDGVPESDVADVARRLQVRAGLQVVNGGRTGGEA